MTCGSFDVMSVKAHRVLLAVNSRVTTHTVRPKLTFKCTFPLEGSKLCLSHVALCYAEFKNCTKLAVTIETNVHKSDTFA